MVMVSIELQSYGTFTGVELLSIGYGEHKAAERLECGLLNEHETAEIASC